MTARLAQANLASKSDIANFIKKTAFDDKLKYLNKNVISNKTKHVLVENELNELLEKVKAISTKRLTKNLINKFGIFNGAKYFSSVIFQSYLVFIPPKKCIKYFSGTTRIDLWKSNGMSKENIENITKSGGNVAPANFVDHHVLAVMSFNGHYIRKNNISIRKKVIILYNSDIIKPWLRNSNTNFTLNNCLIGPVKLTKNADSDKYKYSAYS